MSQRLINRSADLKRLRDEGFDVAVVSGYLLIYDVPYVTSRRQVARGTLVSELTISGDVATPPQTHVAYFAGEYPCHRDGSEISEIRHQSEVRTLREGLAIDHSFSAKPTAGAYADYHEKMTTYVAILAGPAAAIDPGASARTFPVVEAAEEESVFHYYDTASSRAGILAATEKLKLGRVAIVGLGGTGSYVLDLVAKTPVGEIHLFDGDAFANHNAFRAPGAPSLDELRASPRKVAYFAERYGRMRRGIVPHDRYLDEETVEALRGMDFAFLCLDRGGDRRLLVERLEAWGIPFVDVGMGVHLVEDSLHGILRVTTSTPAKRDHVRGRGRIPFSDGGGDDAYAQNIQIADLNALNAALAVVRWKKLFGFYVDLEREHFSAYTIDGNVITNDDRP